MAGGAGGGGWGAKVKVRSGPESQVQSRGTQRKTTKKETKKKEVRESHSPLPNLLGAEVALRRELSNGLGSSSRSCRAAGSQ